MSVTVLLLPPELQAGVASEPTREVCCQHRVTTSTRFAFAHRPPPAAQEEEIFMKLAPGALPN